MSVFITVGSTGFDELIKVTTSSLFLDCLSQLNYKRIVYQYGSSEPVFKTNIMDYKGNMDIEGYQYKPSITNDIQAADIVIGHAGSGTILQSLRLNKKLIVVVNKSLMDNHQYELAQAMHIKNYAICSDTSDLVNTIQTIHRFKPALFPEANERVFAEIVDRHMGYQ